METILFTLTYDRGRRERKFGVPLRMALSPTLSQKTFRVGNKIFFPHKKEQCDLQFLLDHEAKLLPVFKAGALTVHNLETGEEINLVEFYTPAKDKKPKEVKQPEPEPEKPADEPKVEPVTSPTPDKVGEEPKAPAEEEKSMIPSETELLTWKFNDLRAKAKELGLSGGGSKKILIERMLNYSQE